MALLIDTRDKNPLWFQSSYFERMVLEQLHIYDNHIWPVATEEIPQSVLLQHLQPESSCLSEPVCKQ